MNKVQSENTDLERVIDGIPVLIIVTDENSIIEYDNIYSMNMSDKIYHEGIQRGSGNYISCINSFISSKVYKNISYCNNCNNYENCKIIKIIRETIKTSIPSESIEIQQVVLKDNIPKKSWFKIKSIPIIKNGENQIVVIITDITEYKEIENKILSLDNFYHSIIKYSPDMLWKIDANKRYVYFNENWEKLTGKNANEFIKENSIIGMHPDDIEDYYKNLIEVYEKKHTFRIEYRLKTISGEYSNILSRANPIYGKDGELSGFVGIDIDVTNNKKRNEELIRLKESAEAANKAKSEFLANMSHEIRTPLNGIIGMTDLTLSTNLTEEQKENLNIVKSCAHTLLSLINNVLDLSKIEAEKVITEEIDFNLKKLINKVIYTNLPKANEKYIQLHFNIDNEVPEILIGDEYRIEQILNNLISNAVKFTENGFVMLNVNKINNINEIFEIKFTVEDVGIGISEDEMKFLFKSFTQVDGSITRKYGGTGLGLKISQKLVELMGGHIEVESKKGVGSKFYFIIKLQEAKNILEKSKIEINSTKILRRESILLVDDSDINKIVIKKMLQEMGCSKIKIASNGIEALKLMENYKFDIILMDIQMPELDGIETVQIIREKEKKSGMHIPIIAITSHALKGDREKFLSKGMDEYISKPIDINEFNKTIAKIQNNIHNDDTNIIKSYLKSDEDYVQNHIVKVDNDIRMNLLYWIIELDSYFKAEKEMHKDYSEIEKIAHNIKIKAEENNLNNIKTLAFKIELAARKKNDTNILVNLEKISIILKRDI